jgi:mgtE-like transporter
MYSSRNIVRESAPILAVLTLVQVTAGQTLNLESGSLLSAPILLLLVPAVNAVGGNVGSILGARVSSGLHLGSIQPTLRSERMWVNVGQALVAGIVTFAFLAFVVHWGAPALGVQPSLTFAQLLLLLGLTGLALTASLAAVAVAAAFVAFRQGMDPDNAVIPVVTSVGDLLGIVWLIVVYGVIT